MTDKETTKKTAAKPHRYETLDMSTPFAAAMKMWQGEMDKVFTQTSKNLERSFEMSRKLLDEQSKLAEAQLDATQDALKVFADGMERIAKTGAEA
jgi:protein-disulfide isomerase